MPPVNKVCFAYPVKYKKEMTAEECCMPAEHFHDLEAGTRSHLIVTVGLMVTLIDKIFINVEIIRQGSTHDDSDFERGGKIDNLRTHMLPNQQGIFLSSMVVENVLFDQSGLYEIIVKLVSADENGNKDDEALDTYRSYFYASVKRSA